MWHNFFLSFAALRADEETVSKQSIQKQLRELVNQLQEVQEDLEAEREARNKAEKLKRDLNEVCILIKAMMTRDSPTPQQVINIYLMVIMKMFRHRSLNIICVC